MLSICNDTISSISFSLNGVNIIVSSIRLRNSGRMVCFNIFKTASFVFSMTSVLLAGVIFSKFSRIKAEPIFEVMMIMVFLKLTNRPLLSVNRPSSSTCNRMLKMSG